MANALPGIVQKRRKKSPKFDYNTLFYTKIKAIFHHCDNAMVNRELLCPKLPSAWFPVVSIRVFTRSSGIGISHSLSWMSKHVSI